MQGSSLALRLFVLAAIWSALSLAAAGSVLIAVYRGSAERAFDERLGVYLKTLVGAIAAQSDTAGSFREPDNVGEPRFELPLSGWYWVVRRSADNKVVVASKSLVGDVLVLPSDVGIAPGADRTAKGYIQGPDRQDLRIIEREISFDEQNAFRLAVAGNAGDLNEDITVFSTRTALILALVGFGLVITTYFQVRLGLFPIERMRRALFAIRSGEAERLEGTFPSEIEPLAQELNALIESNRETMERARTHVGNLAHALKTPLSVITNEARGTEGTLAARIAEQAGLMREYIDTHLERARMAAQRRVIGAVTDVEPVVERLARAMRKIFERKGVVVETDIQPGLRFRGERQDLEETLGNLMDNASKWCIGRVSVTARIEGNPRADDRRFLTIWVDDDGPGLSPEKRLEAVKRGQRLDETVPGTGLGLSIVTDLAVLYGGRFQLLDSPLGGLRCELVLPAL
ncbi:ATP-binding protein [Prosthecodimorpha staleyi]|uniref:histidine kinase n=1 Tax=Prosthecodimorpha staleyi TaxID=2840188 RepID=A0A947D1L8_9HYPH|nr:ATP-binding protein [Prosthecodimorpha staleyi]MBT9289105.1 histidine kinase [Prosthecodimorpha staleyi]